MNAFLEPVSALSSFFGVCDDSTGMCDSASDFSFVMVQFLRMSLSIVGYGA